MTDKIETALKKAYLLGQTFMQQADSESYAQNRRSFETQARFEALVGETVAQQSASVGEEIMVNAAHDVYTLPLQPSGLASGPRFVVHVPGPEAQPAAHPATTHCDNCGCDWLDNGLNPVGCPYCKQNALREEVALERNLKADAIHACAMANIRAERLAEALRVSREVRLWPSTTSSLHYSNIESIEADLAKIDAAPSKENSDD